VIDYLEVYGTELEAHFLLNSPQQTIFRSHENTSGKLYLGLAVGIYEKGEGSEYRKLKGVTKQSPIRWREGETGEGES
jgi:hypothetical protein